MFQFSTIKLPLAKETDRNQRYRVPCIVLMFPSLSLSLWRLEIASSSLPKNLISFSQILRSFIGLLLVLLLLVLVLVLIDEQTTTRRGRRNAVVEEKNNHEEFLIEFLQ